MYKCGKSARYHSYSSWLSDDDDNDRGGARTKANDATTVIAAGTICVVCIQVYSITTTKQSQ